MNFLDSLTKRDKLQISSMALAAIARIALYTVIIWFVAKGVTHIEEHGLKDIAERIWYGRP